MFFSISLTSVRVPQEPKTEARFLTAPRNRVVRKVAVELVVVMYRVVMSKDSEGVYKFNNKYNFGVSGAGRIFLDNIKITK